MINNKVTSLKNEKNALWFKVSLLLCKQYGELNEFEYLNLEENTISAICQ